MRALITGAGGFAGRYLVQHLAQATEWELWGTERPPDDVQGQNTIPPVPSANVETARRSEIAGRPALTPEWTAQHGLKTVPLELTDFGSVRDLLAEVRPDFMFHLAAQAIVQQALRDPEATW